MCGRACIRVWGMRCVPFLIVEWEIHMVLHACVHEHLHKPLCMDVRHKWGEEATRNRKKEVDGKAKTRTGRKAFAMYLAVARVSPRLPYAAAFHASRSECGHKHPPTVPPSGPALLRCVRYVNPLAFIWATVVLQIHASELQPSRGQQMLLQTCPSRKPGFQASHRELPCFLV